LLLVIVIDRELKCLGSVSMFVCNILCSWSVIHSNECKKIFLPVSQSLKTVTAPPYWRNGQPPEDVNTAEEESAQFNCEVEGVPTPEISWLVNGVPIEGILTMFLFYRTVYALDIQFACRQTHYYDWGKFIMVRKYIT